MTRRFACGVVVRLCAAVALCAILAGCARDARWLLAVQNEMPPFALHGSIVTEDGAKDGWVVFHRGVIAAVGCQEDQIPLTARKIRYPGYIFPGLIDTHNHPYCNAFPKWRPGRLFQNRYEWIGDKEYREKADAANAALDKAKANYAALKYGEIRALLGGATCVQGSYAPPESAVLARNLYSVYQADAYTLDIRKLSADERKRLLHGLITGKLRRYFFHLAEGVDAKSAEEFDLLRGRGLLRSGVVLIHGVALGRPQFRAMAKAGVGLVWSPQSNLVLYGKTADVAAAIEEGVTVALAPDWTLTGSDNLLAELKVAREYSQRSLGGRISPRDLFRMVTTQAARVAGLQGFLGKIEPKYAADLFLAPKLDADPFLSLLKTQPQDIHLLFVDGFPTYGDADAMAELLPQGVADGIEVKGARKAIVTVGDPRVAPRSQEHFSDIVRILQGALPALAPLVED